MSYFNTRAISMVLASSLLGACGADSVETSTDVIPGIGEGVLELRTDMKADTDIAGVRYEATQVNCETGEATGAEPVEAITDLSDVRLPGMIGPFEDSPLDRGSSHIIADQYFVLPAGCYDVLATPVDAEGNDSQDCGPARQDRVEVRDSETTEIMMISQCVGPAVGGLDVILAFNHPPVIVNLEYEPDKFVFECEELELCVTVSDPDNDPVEIVWSRVGGQPWFAGPEVVREQQRDLRTGEITECIQVAANVTGRHNFRVEVFDLLHHDGELRRFEEWYAEFSVPQQSRDTLNSHFYVNWDIEAACFDDESGELMPFEGAREIQRADECRWVRPVDFYCSPHYLSPEERAIYCPGGELDPAAVYPACE